ncbi:MAG: p-hydroxyphenylacetate 3-hydroxylase reductase component [Hyphomicrobiaceae bacterium]
MTNQKSGSEFDARAFRRALGNFATGVTIVTAQGPDGAKVGVTASSFNSLSLDPPLILWSSLKSSRSRAVFEAASHFAVNVLAFDQMDLSNHFARQQDDKFVDMTWHEGIGGSPIFPKCAGRFQCETHNIVDGGDHVLFIGKVITFDDFGRSPLCFHQGSYSMVVNHPGSAPNASERTPTGTLAGRASNHTFFQMLMALRAYQANYQPKLETLEISLIEARSLLMLNDQPGLTAEQLVALVNSPITEVDVALFNLSSRGLVIHSGDGYAVTNDGRAKANECWSVAEAHAEEAFNGVSKEQVDTFRSVLRHLIAQ